MKKTLLLALLTTAAAMPAAAQRYDNYKPDNCDVRLYKTNLPIVFLRVDGQQIDRENRITARMKIISNADGVNYGDTLAHPGQTADYDGYIALKYRGNSSFTNSDKKPYAIRPLDKPLEEGGKKQKAAIMGMPADNDWALLAPYADKSMIRDALSFTLARPYFDFVPHMRHCELILDGTYYGVYIMSERVTAGKNRLNLKDPGDNGDKLTGGYLLEVDRNDEEVYTSKHHPKDADGNDVAWKNVYFQSKSMDWAEMTDAQRDYIQRQIDRMENSFAADNYKDPDEGYRKYIDVTSFIDYQLSTEFAHNVDGYRLSTNIYKHRDSQDPRFKTSLWDMNLGFGNSDYYDGSRSDTWIYDSNATLISANDNSLVPFWWARMMSDENYVDALKKRWTEYRHGAYSDENITATIDSLTTLLNAQGAQERNFKAWPRWGQYVWPEKYVAENYDQEIAYIKNWIKRRLKFMDRALLLDEDPTGVELNAADGTAAKHIRAIYAPSGTRLARMEKGLNIVMYADGTARKVVKK